MLSMAFGLELAWKSLLILGGAGLAVLTLRRSTAAARHLIWSLGTAGLLALPLLMLAVPAWTWAVIPAARGNRTPPPEGRSNGPAVVGRPHDLPTRVLDRPRGGAADASSQRAVGTVASGRTPLAAKATRVEPTSSGLFMSPAAWMLGSWSIVACFLLVRPLMGRLGLRRLVRDARPWDGGEWEALTRLVRTQLGVRRRVTLLRSGSALMPMTWGWLRPVILLPAEADAWPADRLRDVLLHEMAHVRRFDSLTQTVAQLACAIYWFNPLAWLADLRMRVERERACDDMVLGAGARPSDYALLLIDMSKRLHSRKSADVAAVAMARPSSLEGRLVAILDPNLRRGRLGRLASATIVVALAAVVFPLSALRLEAQQAESTSREAVVNPPESKRDRTRRMTVAGTVLDPDGKPVKNAVVDVLGVPKEVWVGASVDDPSYTILGQAKTDGDGRFRLETQRLSSTGFTRALVLAGAKGYGLSSAPLKPDAERPDVEIRLRREQPARVTLVDVTGMPASGVEVAVQGVMPEPLNDKNEQDAVYLSGSLPEGLRAWPAKTTTDDQGQFLLHGIGGGLSVYLNIRDLRYATQTPTVKLGSQGTLQESAVALEPARIIAGRVVAADTGKPIPNAIIAAAAHIQNDHANGYFTTKFRADAEGRFKINPMSSQEYILDAFAPAGEPYLIAHGELKWVKGAVKVDHDFKLKRGVVIRGRVTEQGSGRPLAGSSIQFMPIKGGDDLLSGWQAMVASGDDGRYQVVVPPGKGHLLFFGPTSDFVLEAISERMVYSGKPGGRRHYAHKVIPYEVEAGPDPVEHDAPLRAARTVTIRVVGPNGETVTDGFYATALEISPTNPSWRGDSQTRIADGRFELHGLAPEKTAHVDILDDEHQWGASVEVSGKQAGTELTVTLQPCGRAKARFLRPDGQPVVNHAPNFEYIATPGPHPFTRDKKQEAELAADAEYMPNLDRKHYWDGVFTDAEGRITLPALIPGARYRINDFSTVNDPDKGVQVRRDFSVKPGETLDLGDILIEKSGG